MSVEIRDRRERGFFIIDNEVIDSYKNLSVYAVAVYAVICRHAFSTTQSCNISLDRIADEARISRSTAKRHMKELIDSGLVKVERQADSMSIYTLLKLQKQGVHSDPPPVHRDLPGGSQRPTNNTRTKTTTKLNLTDESVGVHARIATFIQNLHGKHFNQVCQWDGSEGKELAKLIKSNPSWNPEDYERMIRNRFKSEAVSPDRPRSWLSNLGKWGAGPLDRYGHQPETQIKIPARQKAVANAIDEAFS